MNIGAFAGTVRDARHVRHRHRGRPLAKPQGIGPEAGDGGRITELVEELREHKLRERFPSSHART